VTTVNENCHLQITPLQYIDVCVNDVQCKGLIDSGAQITVLSQQVFDKLKPDVCGYVNIQGIVGDVIRAPLVNVNIKSNEGQSYVNVGEGLQVTCAIASLTNVEHDVVLPVDIVNDIQRLPTISVLTCTVMSNDSDIKVNDTNEGHLTLDDCQTIIDVDANVNPDLVEEHDNKPTPTENIDEVSISDDLENSEISLEQQNCSTLSHCWDMARSSFKITYCIIMIKSNNSLFVSCVYPSVGDLLSCT